eukprot:scaffold16501_cov72-Phaeocystis_antarctica.AAC.6
MSPYDGPNEQEHRVRPQDRPSSGVPLVGGLDRRATAHLHPVVDGGCHVRDAHELLAARTGVGSLPQHHPHGVAQALAVHLGQWSRLPVQHPLDEPGPRVERWPEGHQLVNDASERPDVAFVAADTTVPHLRADVDRASIVALARLVGLVNHDGAPQVTNLDDAVLGDEDVGWLDVTVDHTEGVHVVEREDELCDPQAEKELVEVRLLVILVEQVALH